MNKEYVEKITEPKWKERHMDMFGFMARQPLEVINAKFIFIPINISISHNSV